MKQMWSFGRDDVYPSWFVNSLGRHLSLLASNFALVLSDPTHIQVPAGADDQAAICAVAGLWRWVEAPVTRAHPGGSAGTYDVFVTAKNNDIRNTPAPYSDFTDYTFGLAIVGSGSTPAIVAGTVDQFRRVGTCQWDGSSITRIDQLIPGTSRHAARHFTGGVDPIAPHDIGAASASDLTSAIAASEALPPNPHAASHRAGGSDYLAGVPPVGALMSYAGAGDPPEGEWVIADGRLIDRTVYASFFGRVGHAYNGSVDPGSNKVKIPDKRGRHSVGAINMGTTAGPADNAHVQASRGGNGGEVNHGLSTTEMPSHSHGGATGADSPDHAHSGSTGTDSPDHAHMGPSGYNIIASSPGGQLVSEAPQTGHTPAVTTNGPIAFGGSAGASARHAHAFATGGASARHAHGIGAEGGSGAHNNVAPYEADSVLVRIA